MAVYDLIGSGVIGLSAGVERIFVDVLVFPTNASIGRGVPANYYDLGLLRLGVTGAYGRVIPIDATTMFIDLPAGITSLGYALFNTTAIRVSEDIPVIPPGEELSLITPSHIPTSTYTNDQDYVLGVDLDTSADVHAVGLRFWRAPTDTLHSSISYEIAVSGGGGATLKTGVQTGMVSGWNTWHFTPIALPIQHYTFKILSLSGGVRGAENGLWNEALNAPLSGVDCPWTPSSDLSDVPFNVSDVWPGMDFLVTVD